MRSSHVTAPHGAGCPVAGCGGGTVAAVPHRSPHNEKPEPAVRRTPRSLLHCVVALAAAASTVLAGCSSAPSGDTVAWTGGLCGAMVKFVDTAKTQPSFTDPGKVVEALSEYLGKVSTAAQGTLDSIKTLGPSPVDGGDEIVIKLDQTVTTMKTAFDSTRAKLANVDATDQAALTAALSDITNLQSGQQFDFGSINSNPELNAAAEKAPECQQLRSVAGG